MKNSTLVGYSILILILGGHLSCKDSIEAVPFEEVRNVLATDDGNAGNGSDIEVNFSKQFEPEGVEIYKISVVKADQISALDLEAIEELSEDLFTLVNPKDIFPVQGKRLVATTKDIDGDLIKEHQPYRVVVTTIPNNKEMWKASLTFSNEDLILMQNNQVRNHSSEMEAGSGSLAIDANGQLVMASYNIIAELTNDQEAKFDLFAFNKSGSFTVWGSGLDLMGGNAYDSQNQLFQAVKGSGEILKMNSTGDILPFVITGFPINRPDGLYVDGSDVLFAADYQTGNIVKVSSEGLAELYGSVGPGVRGITGDEAGNIYISVNEREGRIVKINTDGEISEFARIPTFVPESYLPEFIMWVGYLTYFREHLYVAGLSTHKIYKIDMQGNVQTFAGSGTKFIPKGGAKTANFNRPMGLAFSNDGKSLFVSGCLDVVPQHIQASQPSRVYEIELVE